MKIEDIDLEAVEAFSKAKYESLAENEKTNLEKVVYILQQSEVTKQGQTAAVMLYLGLIGASESEQMAKLVGAIAVAVDEGIELRKRVEKLEEALNFNGEETVQ